VAPEVSPEIVIGNVTEGMTVPPAPGLPSVPGVNPERPYSNETLPKHVEQYELILSDVVVNAVRLDTNGDSQTSGQSILK
jgi:hypothetical protein